MQTVLIVFHLMVVLALVGAVLLQRSEGGALGMGGGGGGLMTGRGQANALTRATAILAALFFATSLALTLLANYNRAPKSIIDSAPASAPAQTSAPAGAAPGANPSSAPSPLDELKKLEEKGPQAPTVPNSQ